MSNGISDLLMHKTAYEAVVDTKKDIYRIQQAQKEGVQNTTFTSMEPQDATNAFRAEIALEEHKQILQSLKLADSSLNTLNQYEILLKQMLENVDDFQHKIAIANTPAGRAIDIKMTAELALTGLQTLLNTRVSGQYIFSGSMGNTQPVRDIVNISNLDADRKPTATYYHGDDFDISMNVGSQEFRYGIQANDPAFQQFIGALHIFKTQNRQSSGNLPGFNKITELLNSARQGLLKMQFRAGTVHAEIKKTSTTVEAEFQVLSREYEVLNGINDPEKQAQLVLEISENMTRLNSIFTITKRILSMSFADYIK
ncbi:hypothetical protein MIDIC_20058 [Alphaproteobacteria bacterium]